MGIIEDERQKIILIVDPDTLLSASLTHMLARAPCVESPSIVAASRAELGPAVMAHHPHIVVVPSFDLRLSEAELAALFGTSPVPRVILISPDCNTAYVYDLSRASVTAVHELLALIPRD